MVFHLDKCIGCHTCSIACKNVWTDRKGTEYMWWNNVETKPGTGYPDGLGRPGEVPGRLGGQRQAAVAVDRQGQGDLQHLSPPAHAQPGRLLRTVDLQLRGSVQRAGGPGPAGRPADLEDHRRTDRHRGGAELGRRPGRISGLRRERSEPGRLDARTAGAVVRRRAAGVLLLPADLQSLPESGLRGGLSLRGAVQAGRGRHRAAGSETLPGLAGLRGGLPLQEDVLQLVDRQVGEVHSVLPPRGDGPGAGLLPQLRRPDPLPGCAAVRRRADRGSGPHAGRRTDRGPTVADPRPARSRGDRRGRAKNGMPESTHRGGAEIAGLPVRQGLEDRPAAAPGVPHAADAVLRAAHVAGDVQSPRRRCWSTTATTCSTTSTRPACR